MRVHGVHRRQYLALAGAGAISPVPGCIAAPASVGREGPDPSRAESSFSPDLPVSESEFYRAVPRDAIPAIVDPTFAPDWDGVSVTVASAPLRETIEPRLADGSQVVGITRGDRSRAYPLSVLAWHEVVNDSFGDPVLVTYCPLCGSGVVARRAVGGHTTVFGVSGLLWNANLVMYDRRTASLWSQLAATAIQGPSTGQSLTLVPSLLTTWGSWRSTHPDTEVLLPPPYSNTVRGRDATENYTLDPYLAYSTSDAVGVQGTEPTDRRLHPKMPVIGVTAGGVSKAYPLAVVERRSVVNDTVGGQPIVVAIAADRSLVAYHRLVNGTTLRFTAGDEAHMHAGRSRWATITGRAIDGPHKGTRLRRANDRSPMFWFAWTTLHPGTRLHR